MSIFLSVGTPLPHGWKRTQLRRLVDIRNGRDYKAVEVTEGGYPVYGSGGEFRRASEFLHDGESILFGRKGTIDRPLYVDGKFWTVDTMYYAVPFEHVCARFMYYFATTIPFNYYVTSTALPSVTQSDLAGHPIDLPPLDEQRAIADYLDRETKKIDDLITEQRSLIETLRERRKAVITRAVTVGIRDDARMQQVDEPALDQIPKSWQIRRIKTVGRAIIGLTYTPEDIVDEGEGRLVLRAGNIQRGALSLENNVYVDRKLTEDLKIRVGDIVICARNGSSDLIGKNAVATQEVVGETWGAFMAVLRSDINEYLRWVLNSEIFRAQTGLFSTSTINQLTSKTLHNLKFGLPSESERNEISRYLDEQTSRIDSLISESEDLISLSEERRAALITAAVTGQIDVRTTS